MKSANRLARLLQAGVPELEMHEVRPFLKLYRKSNIFKNSVKSPVQRKLVYKPKKK